MALVTTIVKSRISVNLGTITAVSAPIQFGLGDMSQAYRGQLTLVASGGAVTSPTWVLEGSIDGGSTWFVIPPQTTLPLALAGQLSGDTAPLAAYQYNVSGLSSCLLKFGATAGSAWTATNIYALVG